jgi:hypothetical protein
MAFLPYFRASSVLAASRPPALAQSRRDPELPLLFRPCFRPSTQQPQPLELIIQMSVSARAEDSDQKQDNVHQLEEVIPLQLNPEENLENLIHHLIPPILRAGLAVGLVVGMSLMAPNLGLSTHLLWGLLSISLAPPLGPASGVSLIRWIKDALIVETGVLLWAKFCTPLLQLLAFRQQDSILRWGTNLIHGLYLWPRQLLHWALRTLGTGLSHLLR